MPKRKNPFLAIAEVLKTAVTSSFGETTAPAASTSTEDINDRLRKQRHAEGRGGLFNNGAHAPVHDKVR